MNSFHEPLFDGFLAFGDESDSVSRLDPGTYIPSAAIVDPEHLEDRRRSRRSIGRGT